MKGIILAGGSGTRLYPATAAISKQLLPIYDKPMIYYPLSVLMLAGIRDILIISTPQDTPRFELLLQNGEQWGLNLRYSIQENPNGLAEAFIIGKNFIGDDSCAMILGDNIFYGNDLSQLLQQAVARKSGSTVFAYRVSDPERYGVIEFDHNNKPQRIIEKPKQPLSPFAITGLYFYDNRVIDIAESLKPSARGELEITDINQRYLEMGELHVQIMNRGIAWLDTGTFDSLMNASEFIRTIQNRQGVQIACLEEIAFRMGYIDLYRLRKIGEAMKQNSYGKYLLAIADEEMS
ncbi:MAG: glucose-1-phosphate thymidylyltransferase RfbA [Chlamydiales bacterium]|nr:glucose-1-phosphate thymidylyltransferase RfbA [Chlamydiales bacterium]